MDVFERICTFVERWHADVGKHVGEDLEHSELSFLCGVVVFEKLVEALLLHQVDEQESSGGSGLRVDGQFSKVLGLSERRQKLEMSEKLERECGEHSELLLKHAAFGFTTGVQTERVFE